MSEPVPAGNTKFRVENFEGDHCGIRTTIWFQLLMEGERFESCETPENYKHVMANRSPAVGDIVQVRNHDKSQLVEFIVLESSKSGLRLQRLREATRPDVVLPADIALGIKWNVGARKYDVVRKSDNQVIQPGFALKENAAEWIIQHVSALRRAA